MINISRGNMKKEIEQVFAEIENDKAEIKAVFGKDNNLTLDDFIKYCETKYNCVWYDSVDEWLKKWYNKKVDYNTYIDDFAMDIIKTTHKIVDLSMCNTNKFGDWTKVFFSYENNIITDMYIENAHVIDKPDPLFLFVKGWEERTKARVIREFSMTEEELDEAVRDILGEDQPDSKRKKKTRKRKR